MTDEKLVFDGTFEAFARALGTHLNSETRQRLRAFGVDYDDLLPAYPFEVWLKTMELGANLLLPTGTTEEKYFNLGYRIVGSYGESLIGRTLLTMMRLIGPRRSLARMTRNLRTANNFTEVVVRDLPDGRTLVTCKPVVEPGFFRGMFTAAMELSGGKNVQVELVEFQNAQAEYAVRWK